MRILIPFAVLLATTFDYTARQLYPGRLGVINIIFFVLILFCVAVFTVYFRSAWPISKPSQGSDVIVLEKDLVSVIAKGSDPLLVLRFFAALLVFITHMAILLRPMSSLAQGNMNLIVWGGAWTGMDIFFTLSGYLMGKAFLTGRYATTRDGILQFYQNRLTRIFPLMLFVLVILVLLKNPQILRYDLADTLRVLTFNYYGRTLPVVGIGAMWSLSVEMQYYLISPFVFLFFHRLFTKSVRLGCLALAVLVGITTIVKIFLEHHTYVQNGTENSQFFSLLGNLSFFLIGYMFNYIKISMPKWLIERIASPFAFLYLLPFFTALVSILQGTIAVRMTAWHYAYYLIVSVAVGFVILVLESVRVLRQTSRAKYDFTWFLERLGILSYGLYLWHSAIGDSYSHLYPRGFSEAPSYVFNCAIVFAATLFLSLLTYLAIEDRFNRYKQLGRSA